jgi:hypothetical protein
VLSYRAHTVKQLVDYNGCYTGIDIGHGVGNDQLVVMNYRTAGINNIGNISLTPYPDSGSFIGSILYDPERMKLYHEYWPLVSFLNVGTVR